jgi:hypothetical protein
LTEEGLHFQVWEQFNIVFGHPQLQEHDAVDTISNRLWNCRPWFRYGLSGEEEIKPYIFDFVIM